ncbi:hypothetical protein EMPG_11725 [Blastomyces silverae]|uniref:Major facilitator superfamily (MFS) profile domain-containing protein n=1 Tax=Blastomyces silverae TaxID=2060906 RepID=A0A0H1BPA1_9EURO|nr:hypothetical protein EMPG_11725 [Blastomyces silverae]
MRDHASGDQFPPGTILLEDRKLHILLSSLDSPTHSILGNASVSELILSLTLMSDSDEPLIVNFGLACSYVLFTFVLIDINSLAYRGYIAELGLNYSNFNNASASNFAGLAFGCLLLIPCVHKYGRRPLYLISAVVQFACAIWWANFHRAGELIGVSLLAGLSGSISEAIVMIFYGKRARVRTAAHMYRKFSSHQLVQRPHWYRRYNRRERYILC